MMGMSSAVLPKALPKTLSMALKLPKLELQLSGEWQPMAR